MYTKKKKKKKKERGENIRWHQINCNYVLKKKMAIMDLDPFPLNPPTPLIFI